MLKIAFCDDDLKQCEEIQALLLEYFKKDADIKQYTEGKTGSFKLYIYF